MIINNSNNQNAAQREKNIRSLIMEKIESAPKQNFSAILNSPNETTSYYDDFKNMLYSTLYDEKSSLDFEISKDYEKFSNVDIDLGSPRSVSSSSVHSQPIKTKATLKELLNENFDSYINSISYPYQSFKANHYTKGKFVAPHQKDHVIYQTNTKIIKSIESFYFEDQANFKIKPQILEQKISDIDKTWKILIEKSGGVELELIKTLEHSNRMQNYIFENLEPFNEKINTLNARITSFKNIKSQIRGKLIANSSKLILKGIKKKNIKDLYSALHKIKMIKQSLDVLRILATEQKKFQIAFSLITRAKEEINELKKKHSSQVKIFTAFEKSYKSYLEQIIDVMNTQFSAKIINLFSGFISVEKGPSENTSEFYGISTYTFDKLISSSYGASNLIKHLSFVMPNKFNEIRELIKCYAKIDILDTFHTKIKDLLQKSASDLYKTTKKKLNDYVNLKEPSQLNNNDISGQIQVIADSEKIEQTFLLFFILFKKKVFTAFNLVSEEICTIIENLGKEMSEQKTIPSKESFKRELDQALINIDNEFDLHSQVEKCLKEMSSHSNLDTFIDNFYIVRDILGDSLDLKEDFINCQNDYISSWFKGKMSKFSSSLYRNWEEIQEIPCNFQIILDIFMTYEISSNYVGKQKSNRFPIEIINKFSQLESGYQVTEATNFVKINSIQLKCNQCSLDVIKTSYEVLKLFSWFSTETWDNILLVYSKLLDNYAKYQKDQVLSIENTTVTQEEISMVNSIVELIKQLRFQVAKCESFSLLKKNIAASTMDEFFNLDDVLDSLGETCKSKIINLINTDCVENSIRDLEAMKLPKYTVVTRTDVPVNDYVYKFIKQLRNIYNGVVNSFEPSFIVKTIDTSFEKYFKRLENFIFNGQKIVDESSLVQFKKDMIFLKKNLGIFADIDTSKFKSRIDGINKKVLPERLLQKKKNAEAK